MVVLIALSVVRGVAFPTGYEYDGLDAGIQTFRVAMTFSVYYITLAMARGVKSRRAIATAVVLGLLPRRWSPSRTGAAARRARERLVRPAQRAGRLPRDVHGVRRRHDPATRRLLLQLALAGVVVSGTVATLFTVRAARSSRSGWRSGSWRCAARAL